MLKIDVVKGMAATQHQRELVKKLTEEALRAPAKAEDEEDDEEEGEAKVREMLQELTVVSPWGFPEDARFTALLANTSFHTNFKCFKMWFAKTARAVA